MKRRPLSGASVLITSPSPARARYAAARTAGLDENNASEVAALLAAVPHSIASAKDAGHVGTPVADALAYVAPAIAPAPVSVPFNGAQAHTLARYAVRYRCTVGELVQSLTFHALTTLSAEPHDFDAQDGKILRALLHFADAKKVPHGLLCPDLPDRCDLVNLRAPAHAKERAACLLRDYALAAACIRDSEQGGVDYEEEDIRIKDLHAALKA